MYTKNTWESGDVITKVKLDNMEDGIYDAYKLPVKKKLILVSSNDVTVASGGTELITSSALIESEDYSEITISEIDTAGANALVIYNGSSNGSNDWVITNMEYNTNPFDFYCMVKNTAGASQTQPVQFNFDVYIFA